MKSLPFRIRFMVWYSLPEQVNTQADLDTEVNWHIFEPERNIGSWVVAVADAKRCKQEFPEARVWIDRCESFYVPGLEPANDSRQIKPVV